MNMDTLPSCSPSPTKHDNASAPISANSAAPRPSSAQEVNEAVHAEPGSLRLATFEETRALVKSLTPNWEADISFTTEEKKAPAPNIQSVNGQNDASIAREQVPNSTLESVPAACSCEMSTQIPSWLKDAMCNLRDGYPDDKFEIVPRKKTSGPPGWRMKCSDCPGKLYHTGPGESLSNFKIHLRNRQHRRRVKERVDAEATAVAPTPELDDNFAMLTLSIRARL
ncbi:hypothetical protein D9756_008684 [Leucocoprinus leucothites]|uniref:Uncharacterized protein n=1 Tax=Leucocoprinus leucothites TaxID=201217 RepID=A0A8H5D1K0_9AGAR|nr:hypothetical protein D9756_008684 [Leucoagaricus leucothites]